MLHALLVPILTGTEKIPQWLVTGCTTLIPKEGYSGQMRLITCLNIAYKFLTKMITYMLTRLTDANGSMPAPQKALRKFRRGCADALWTDQTLVTESIRDRKSLSVAWIDYSKAFDRVHPESGTSPEIPPKMRAKPHENLVIGIFIPYK